MSMALNKDQSGREEGQTRRPIALRELSRLARLAGPLWAQNFSQMALGLIAIAFVGRLGDPLALSQVVMATSVFNITGAIIIMGLSAGMETFCGQAMGAGNHALLGVVLQRASLICLLVCLPISVLWSRIGSVLLAVGQPPAIVGGAARYLWRAVPALPLMAMSECLKRYLLAQRVVLPGTLTAFATTLCAPLIYSYAMKHASRPLDGAATAFSLCTGASTIMLLIYVIWRDRRHAGRPDATWRGLSLDALRDWGGYLALALPALGAIAAEWLAYEVIVMMSGFLHDSEVAVGVMGLAFQISAAVYMSAMALSAAVNTRVANELGAGAPSAAATSCWVGVTTAFVIQSALSLGVGFSGRRVVAVFSSDSKVSAMATGLLPVLIPTFVGDGTNAVLQGILRGAGRQSLGAALNFGGWWCLGVPLALALGFWAHLGVKGFWGAILVTTSLQAVLQLAVISRFDWSAECRRAKSLVGDGPGCGDALAAGAGAGQGGGGDPEVGGEGADEARPLLLDTLPSFSDRGNGSFASRGPSTAGSLVWGGGGGGIEGAGSLVAAGSGDVAHRRVSDMSIELSPEMLPHSVQRHSSADGEHRHVKSPTHAAGQRGRDTHGQRDQE